MPDLPVPYRRVIVITGASSGLGAALAEQYAAHDVMLGLLGRSGQRLVEVRAVCEGKGAQVKHASIDVTDARAMALWLQQFDAEYPVDLVIANAGISAGTGGADGMEEVTRRIFATNVYGVCNSILPLVPAMIRRGKGQVAIISSLAGIRGLPSAPAYSASKAAVRFWGEGLRGQLGKQGIKVSVVCPGYIRTPLTDVNTFPMPFIMSATKAARLIRIGLEKNRARIVFPLPLYIPLWFLSCLSPRLTDWFFARLPEK